jgi:hypothetical protein
MVYIGDAQILFLCATYYGYLKNTWYWSNLRSNLIPEELKLSIDRNFESLQTVFEHSWIRSNIGLARDIYFECIRLHQELKNFELYYGNGIEF